MKTLSQFISRNERQIWKVVDRLKVLKGFLV